jgi:hypothetical protein
MTERERKWIYLCCALCEQGMSQDLVGQSRFCAAWAATSRMRTWPRSWPSIPSAEIRRVADALRESEKLFFDDVLRLCDLAHEVARVESARRQEARRDRRRPPRLPRPAPAPLRQLDEAWSRLCTRAAPDERYRPALLAALQAAPTA